MPPPSARASALIDTTMFHCAKVAVEQHINGHVAPESDKAAEDAVQRLVEHIIQLENPDYPYIEVIRHRGKESAFSRNIALMCHVNLVGADGSKRKLLDQPGNENYALSIVRKWQPILGCKVRFFREQVDTKINIIEEAP